MKPSELVIWIDDALLVVNKPAGLPTLADGYNPTAPYLLGLLQPAFAPLWVVHRLDRDTSGVMVFGRTPDSHRALNAQFEKRLVSKFYHALVIGEPSWSERRVEFPLRVNGDREHRTVIDPQRGLPAVTNLRVLERFRGHALIEAIPQSGRTHQIRAHLAALGHPLVADGLYGLRGELRLSELKAAYKGDKSGERPLLNRPGLHAWRLKFTHPTSGRECTFEAPYPKDFRSTLHQLRKLGA